MIKNWLKSFAVIGLIVVSCATGWVVGGQNENITDGKSLELPRGT